MLRIIGLVVVVLVVVLGASFAYINSGTVTVHLWVRTYELSLPFALFCALMIGWVLGILSTVGVIVRQLREIRRLRRAARLAETEINNLRSIPIRNAH